MNDGVVSFEGDSGLLRVTVGEAVSTVNVTGLLTPFGAPEGAFLGGDGCVLPPPRAGLAASEAEPPPVPAAVAVATADPLTVAPA